VTDRCEENRKKKTEKKRKRTLCKKPAKSAAPELQLLSTKGNCEFKSEAKRLPSAGSQIFRVTIY